MSEGLTTGFVVAEMRRRGYRVIAGPDAPVTGGAADSRMARPGDLFTAFPGENTDGNLYVGAALANGAVAAICERLPEGEWPGRTIVVAPDATRAVSELAAAWRDVCGPRVVGITGTVGKTTAKELTAAVLSAHFRTHKSEGNLNSREGLPLALLTLRTDHEVSVLEMGMDSRGEIARLCAIARPNVGVVLNIGLTHLSKLGSVEAIAAEKLSLPRSLPAEGTAVLNADDARLAEAAPGLACRVLTFGGGEGAGLRRGPVESLGLEGTLFDLSWQDHHTRVRCPLPGEHVVAGALAAIGCALALGLELDEATTALGSARVEGRLRTVRTASGATILDDRYNSSPASLAGDLRLLGSLSGRRLALLGKMAELGEREEEEHRRVGRLAATSCDVLVGFGESCRPLIEAAREAGLREARWFETREEAAAWLAPQLGQGDTLLVKGSRSEALEAVLPLLEGAP